MLERKGQSDLRIGSPRLPQIHRGSAFSRDTSALLVSTPVSGLLAYGYVAIGTRTYGAAPFAPVSVFWTIWAMASAVVAFPVQHWVIRTIEADGNERTRFAPLSRASSAPGRCVRPCWAWPRGFKRSILFSRLGLTPPRARRSDTAGLRGCRADTGQLSRRGVVSWRRLGRSRVENLDPGAGGRGRRSRRLGHRSLCPSRS